MGIRLTVNSILFFLIPVFLLAVSLSTEEPLDKGAAKTTIEKWLWEADSLYDEVEDDSAAALKKAACDLGLKCLSRDDTLYLEVLLLAARHAFPDGSLTTRESLYTEAITLSEELFGANSGRTGEIMADLGYCLYSQGRCDEGRELLRSAAGIESDLQDRTQYRYGAHRYLVYVLWREGKYRESDSVLADATAICEKHADLRTRYLPDLLMERGKQHLVRGFLDSAERYLVRASTIMEDRPIRERDFQVSILSRLARVLLLQGRYREADTCLQRALHVLSCLNRRQRLQRGAMLWNRLGHLHSVQGRLDRAIQGFDSAVACWLALDVHDSRLAEPLGNLGNLFLRVGRLDEAEANLHRALEARTQALGPHHPYLVYQLIGLGDVYLNRHMYSEADSLYLEAFDIVDSAYGADHQHVAWCLDALGGLRHAEGKYRQAEAFHDRALAIKGKVFGDKHPDRAASLLSLARLNGSLGNYPKAADYFDSVRLIHREFVHNVFSYASEEQKLHHVAHYPPVDHSFLSLALLHPDERTLSSALEMVLQGKAIVMEAVLAEKVCAISSPNLAAKQKAEEYSKLCTAIANLLVLDASYFREGQYSDSLNGLIRDKESCETELSYLAGEFRDQLTSRNASVSGVAASLPKDAVLWEFFRYLPYDFSAPGRDEERTGAERYLSVVLETNSDITLRDHGVAEEIDGLIDAARRLIYNSASTINLLGPRKPAEELNAITGRLRETLVGPLEPAFEGKRRIFICPDGQLSVLPFDILRSAEGEYLVEQYAISYLSSGRDLLNLQRPEISSNSAMVIANPDFDLPPAASEAPAEVPAPLPSLRAPDAIRIRGARHCLKSPFLPLRFGEEEMAQVSSMLSTKGQMDVTCVSGADALEEILKDINKPPSVLHLCTEGFFCEDVETSASYTLTNPLLYSGLAFASANQQRTAAGDGGLYTEDGILLAIEAANLNLVGTNLVVLSACETGVGEVKNGEGVFGLRRAFQHTGARSIIMSLWRVADRETCELMQSFYANWLGGMGKRDALRKASLDMIAKLRAEHGVAHPLGPVEKVSQVPLHES